MRPRAALSSALIQHEWRAHAKGRPRAKAGAPLGAPCALTLLLCCACVGVGPWPSPLDSPPPRDTNPSEPWEATAPRSVDPAWVTTKAAANAAGLIPVRLAACEGLDSITIGGTRWGEVHIERAAVVLRASTGDAAPRLHFRPAPAEVLTLAGRPWPGTLTVDLRPQGGLSITNLVPMEEYVSGVLAKELILWSAEPAELEAQAIAARTYALSMLARRRPASTDPGAAFLWSDTRDQAYDGIFVPEDSPAARRVARRLEEAVARTAGLVLTSGSSLLDARFHAACGGRTAALHEQFPTSPGPPIEAVHCPPCDRRALDEARPTAAPVPTARPVTWSTTIPAADLAQLAKDLEIGQRLLSLRPLETGATHRWLTVELTGTRGRTTIPLEEFRRRLGQRAVASAHITSTWPHCGNPLKSGLFLRGRGRGHGVGLCQTGAHDRAVQGWSHSRILSHYYPRARITPLPRHKQTG